MGLDVWGGGVCGGGGWVETGTTGLRDFKTRKAGNKGTRERKGSGVGGASGVSGAGKKADCGIPAASGCGTLGLRDCGTEGTEERKAVFRF